MQPLRIAFCGAARAGKTTRARELERLFEPLTVLSFATPLKAAYAAERGLTVSTVDQHKADHRAGLQAFGEAGRQRGRWITLLDEQLARLEWLGCPHAIVDDLRHDDELVFLRSRGFYVIRLHLDAAVLDARATTSLGRPLSPQEKAHPSETAYQAFSVDEDWDASIDYRLQCRLLLWRLAVQRAGQLSLLE